MPQPVPVPATAPVEATTSPAVADDAMEGARR
jgi:hypothetical protein